MNGFPRPARSYYLDDMGLHIGDRVVCKCNMGAKGFTPGRTYLVHPEGHLMDDIGHLVRPSARFQHPTP
jgi:hypothetical protein